MTRIGRREERGCTSRCLRISGVHIAATKHDALDNSNLSILPTTPPPHCLAQDLEAPSLGEVPSACIF